MPAYRSSAEAEVRDAVVAHLRANRPWARIMHEVNASYYGNRIDVLAVSPAEIIAVEVKSAKDKLDRLPAQIAAMRGVAHHVGVALHERFLVERESNRYAATHERDGAFFRMSLPEAADGMGLTTWVFPAVRRGIDQYDGLYPWRMPDPATQETLPASAIGMLWREELARVCAGCGIEVRARTTMPQMIRALRWQATGGEVTRGICRELRRRACIEADPAIEEAA